MASSSAFFAPFLAAALLLLLVSAQFGTVDALDAQEMVALGEMLRVWPNLAFVSLIDQFTTTGPDYPDYGGSWHPNFADWCLSGDGYEHHGVYCEAGHISAIAITAGWGSPNDADLSFMSGLLFVKNITDRLAVTWSQDVIRELALAVPLESLYMVNSVIDVAAVWPPIMQLSSLRYLRALLIPSLDFSKLTSLTHLIHISTAALAIQIYPLNATLEVLDVPIIFSPFDNVESMVHFTKLRRWICNYCGFSGGPPLIEIILPASLQHFQLRQIWPSTAPINIDVIDPVNEMKSLDLRDLSGAGVTLQGNLTTSLTTLVIDLWTQFNLPTGFDQLYQLESLDLGTFMGGWNNIPSFANFTRFKHFGTLGRTLSVAPEALGTKLCEVIATLESIDIILSYSTSDYLLPACLRYNTTDNGTDVEWTNSPLKTVSVTSANPAVAKFQFSSFIQALPPSVTSITASPCFEKGKPFNSTELYRLQGLEYLNMANNAMTGTLPPDFFQSLPSLSTLNLEYNKLNGTIPWDGYANLRYLSLASNQFQEWPTILDSAPYLTHLIMRGNKLTSMPPDEAFSSMISLSLFDISLNTDLNGPVPAFWANLPVINTVNIQNCGFEGPLPTYIYSPRLANFYFGSNSICGELPKNLTAVFSGSINQLSGSIPYEWVSNQNVFQNLALSKNLLSGTVPNALFSFGSPNRLGVIDLSDNYLSGPIFNLSGTGSGLQLAISGNYFDMCGQGPEMTSDAFSCFIDDHCACASLWSHCTNLAACPPDFMVPGAVPVANSAVPPVANECYVPAPRVTPPEFLPVAPENTPSPIFVPVTVPSSSPLCPVSLPPGFICDSNAIVSVPVSVSAPSIEIPKDVGIIIASGSITVLTSLTFDGLGTVLYLEGCLEAPGGITIKLSETKEVDPVELIKQAEGCPFPLEDLIVKVQEPKSCKKSKLKLNGSTPTTLTVAFVVDASQCNVKWIIVGSVLGGIVLITVIVVVLVVKLKPEAAIFFNPYKGART